MILSTNGCFDLGSHLCRLRQQLCTHKSWLPAFCGFSMAVSLCSNLIVSWGGNVPAPWLSSWYAWHSQVSRGGAVLPIPGSVNYPKATGFGFPSKMEHYGSCRDESRCCPWETNKTSPPSQERKFGFWLPGVERNCLPCCFQHFFFFFFQGLIYF